MENKNPFGPMCRFSKAWEKYFWSQSIFKMMVLNMEDVIADNQTLLSEASKNRFLKPNIVH